MTTLAINVESSTITLAPTITMQAVSEPVRLDVANESTSIDVNSNPLNLTIDATQQASIAHAATIQLITASDTGPQGPPGEMSAATLGTFECGEDIDSSSLIHLSPIDGLLYHADYEDLLPAHGFTIPSAMQGETLTVYRLGSLNGLGSLTPGRPRWLGTAGQTRSTAPSTGIIQNVGVAYAADAIFIELQEPEEVET